jgi:hypothetical protein
VRLPAIARVTALSGAQSQALSDALAAARAAGVSWAAVLDSLCHRQGNPVHCDTAARFTGYTAARGG